MAEQIHLAARWEHADDGNYKRAALHTLRAADLVAVRTTQGAAVLVAEAQVWATLALAAAQEVPSRLTDDAMLKRIERAIIGRTVTTGARAVLEEIREVVDRG